MPIGSEPTDTSRSMSQKPTPLVHADGEQPPVRVKCRTDDVISLPHRRLDERSVFSSVGDLEQDGMSRSRPAWRTAIRPGGNPSHLPPAE